MNPLLWVTSAGLMVAVVFIGLWPTPVFKAAHEATEPLFEPVSTSQVRLP